MPFHPDPPPENLMLCRCSLLRRLPAAAACIFALLSLTGCGGIRKMATITSDPPCAKVWVNGTYRGETPVEMPYNWNWYYDVKLEKPGYHPYVIRERFYAPPQHWVPLDFFVELLPVRSPEPQWRHYQLIPDTEVDINAHQHENSESGIFSRRPGGHHHH